MRLKELFWLFVFKVVLDIAIYTSILPLYAYEPYLNYGQLDLNKLALSYVLLLVFWLIVRPVLNDAYPVSRLVLMVQTMIIVIPFLSLSAQSERNFMDVFFILSPVAAVAIIIKVLPKFKIPQIGRELGFSVLILCALILIYVMLGLIAKGGLTRINFNFYHVYEIREELKDHGFPLSSYLLSWTAYVINIALLVYGLVQRKYLILTLAVILQVLIFGMTNFKAYLFLPFVAIGLVFLLNRMNFILTILVGAVSLILFLLLVGLLGEPMGLGLVRRIMAVPAAMNSLYFDYFSNHPVGLMSGSRWANLFNAPYSESTISIIAQEYWKRDFSPNVGWIGDAYSNFGILGIVIMSIILSLILKLGDSLAKQTSYKGVAESLFIGVSIALCSSGLSTVLITHGGLVALIVVWVLSYYLSKSDQTK